MVASHGDVQMCVSICSLLTIQTDRSFFLFVFLKVRGLLFLMLLHVALFSSRFTPNSRLLSTDVRELDTLSLKYHVVCATSAKKGTFAAFPGYVQ